MSYQNFQHNIQDCGKRLSMGQPNIFVENYNIIQDSICRSSSDSVHIPLDSTLSFNAFVQAQSYFENSFNKINGILSYATTWFTVVLAVISLVVVMKIVWDLWAAKKFFSACLISAKEDLHTTIENYFESNAYIYYKFGNDIAVSSKGGLSRESMKNFLMALNSLCMMTFSNKNFFLYQNVLAGVYKTWTLDLSGGENIFYEPLSHLKNVLSKESDAKGIIQDIDELLNLMDSDEDIEYEENINEE